MTDHNESKQRAELERRAAAAKHRADTDPRRLVNKSPEEQERVRKLAEDIEAAQIKHEKEYPGLVHPPKSGPRTR